MNLPPALRLALIPIGVAIAHKGLSYYSEEMTRLDAEISARVARLAGEDQGDAAEPAEPAGPQDFPCDPPSSRSPGEDFAAAAPAPSRRRTRIGNVLAVLSGVAVGVYAYRRSERWLIERAEQELTGGISNPHRVPIVEDAALPEPAPGTCGVFPAYGDPPTPCTLPPHKSYAHSWEGGAGDDQAPTDEGQGVSLPSPFE